MRFSSLAVLVFSAWMAVPASAQVAGPKIAVVDLQDALNNVNEGKKAKSSLETFFAQKQVEISKKEDEVTAARKSLDAQAPMLDQENRAQREQEWQRMYLSYQQLVVDAQEEMQKMEAEMTNSILEKLADKAVQMAKERGYDMVLEATTVLLVPEGADITDALVTYYNAGK